MRANIPLSGLTVMLLSGCCSQPDCVEVGLVRKVLPRLYSSGTPDIAKSFERKVAVEMPPSAGLVWLAEEPAPTRDAPGPIRITHYARYDLLRSTVDVLRKEPFRDVGLMPTVAFPSFSNPGGLAEGALESIRGACAQFEYDVALILQTSVEEDHGYNFLAIGYLPILTAPLFPGNARAISASAEMIAIDVRTGKPLGCGRGQCMDQHGFMFFWRDGPASRELIESTLSTAINHAAEDIASQLAARFSRPVKSS